jgi:serine/threonine protein kinase
MEEEDEGLRMGELRGSGALGNVYSIVGRPGLVIKTFGCNEHLRREVLFWRHVTNRLGASIPVTFLAVTREGIIMQDGGRSLWQSPSLGRGERFSVLIHKVRDQVCALHRRAGLEHRDLTPMNVMIDPSDGAVRIIDMSNVCVPGHERLLRPHVKLRSTRAGVMCRSPEEMMGLDTIPFAHDAWALGTMILWLCTNLMVSSHSRTSSSSSSSSASSSSGSSSSSSSSGSSSSSSSSGSSASHPSSSSSSSHSSDSASSSHSSYASASVPLSASSTSSPESSLYLPTVCDEDSEFGAMLSEVDAFVRLHGTPESIQIRRKWFIALAGAHLGKQRPLYANVEESMLQVPVPVWKLVRPLLMRLLSEHPSERVKALYDDTAWDRLRKGETEGEALTASTTASTLTASTLTASTPASTLTASTPASTLTASTPASTLTASTSSASTPASTLTASKPAGSGYYTRLRSPALAVMMKFASIPSGKMLDDAVTMLDTRRVDAQLLATINHLCVTFEEYCSAHHCTLLMPEDANIHPLRWVCALAVIDVAVHVCGSFGAATQNVVVEPGKYLRGDQASLALHNMVQVLWDSDSGVASAALERMVDGKYRVRALDWLLDHGDSPPIVSR